MAIFAEGDDLKCGLMEINYILKKIYMPAWGECAAKVPGVITISLSTSILEMCHAVLFF